MSWTFPPSPRVGLPILGRSERFPVRRVFCVGQNYAEHAREMGADGREPPFFFAKSREVIVSPGYFCYPPHSREVHHEIELVVALGSGGKQIPTSSALQSVWGYGVGLDMTCRDVQARAKSSGRPWEAAKSFDQSAVCSPLLPVERSAHPSEGAIWLEIGGQTRQRGDLSQMIWKVPEIVAELSLRFTLAAGDLIFTGTPSGVGAVQVGDRLRGGVEGVAELEVEVVAPD